MSLSDERVLKLVGDLKLSMDIYQLAGDRAGYDNQSIREGWQEIVNIAHEEGTVIQGGMKTYFENGWYEGQARRKKEGLPSILTGDETPAQTKARKKAR